MPWQKGKPRSPNAGRKKGTKNRQTLALEDICLKHDVNPFEAMVIILKDDAFDVGTRLNAAKELCKYLYPQRKAVEHSGEINNPYAEKTIEELETLVKEALK